MDRFDAADAVTVSVAVRLVLAPMTSPGLVTATVKRPAAVPEAGVIDSHDRSLATDHSVLAPEKLTVISCAELAWTSDAPCFVAPNASDAGVTVSAPTTLNTAASL